MKKTMLGLATLLLASSAMAGTVKSTEKVRVDLRDTNMTCRTHPSHTGYIPIDEDEVTLKPQALKLEQRTLLKHETLRGIGFVGLCGKAQSIPVANGVATAKLEITLRTLPDLRNSNSLYLSETVTITFANGVTLQSSASSQMNQD